MKGLTNAYINIARRKIKSVHFSPKGRGGSVEIREMNGDCWSLMALKGKNVLRVITFHAEVYCRILDTAISFT